MTTPLDAAAGVAGLISLGITAFRGCVQGFIILSTARNLGQDADFLRCMIEWERCRFHEWSQQTGLETRNVNPNLNWTLILSLLSQLEVHLNDTGKLRDRYELVIEDVPDEEIIDLELEGRTKIPSLEKLRLRFEPSFFSSSAKIIHEKNKGKPLRRLRWAMIDKAKLESLLQDVRQILSCLWDALAFEDRRHIRSALDRLLRSAITQSSSDVDIAHIGYFAEHESSVVLKASQLRQTRLDIGEVPKVSLSSPKAKTRSQKLKELRLKAALLDENPRWSDEEQAIVRYDGQSVLAETKNLIRSKSRDIREKVLFRAENLAIMLNETNDPAFHVLHCRGVIKRPDQMISIFDLPVELKKHTPEKSSMPVCIPLAELRKAQWIPDLSARLTWALQLAETILQLHTAGWVHKGIRPDHLIFFHAENQPLSELVGVYLSNFNLAREAAMAAFSEDYVSSAYMNSYRHSRAQGEAKASFRPQFDVYALGICLVEIGMWQDIRDILGISSRDIPQHLSEVQNLRNLRAKIAINLPRKFVDGVMMALTFSEDLTPFAPFSKSGDLKEPVMLAQEGADEDYEDDEYPGDEGVDVQQSIVLYLSQCM